MWNVAVRYLRSRVFTLEGRSSGCGTLQMGNCSVGENKCDLGENRCEVGHLELRPRSSRCASVPKIWGNEHIQYLKVETRELQRSSDQTAGSDVRGGTLRRLQGRVRRLDGSVAPCQGAIPVMVVRPGAQPAE
jgi:hypothetical protein